MPMENKARGRHALLLLCWTFVRVDLPQNKGLTPLMLGTEKRMCTYRRREFLLFTIGQTQRGHTNPTLDIA